MASSNVTGFASPERNNDTFVLLAAILFPILFVLLAIVLPILLYFCKMRRKELTRIRQERETQMRRIKFAVPVQHAELVNPDEINDLNMPMAGEVPDDFRQMRIMRPKRAESDQEDEHMEDEYDYEDPHNLEEAARISTSTKSAAEFDPFV